jgi:hypothetical protein
MRLIQSAGSVALVFSMAAPAATSAQEATESSSLGRNLEYRLEIGQHERLVETRKSVGARLAPFESDGCSGGLSVGWNFASKVFPAVTEYHGEKPPWERCCVTHDQTYHTGGPANADAEMSFEARREADEQLRRCVIEVGVQRTGDLATAYGLSSDRVTLLYATIAEIMYKAVRLGGVPCAPVSWRWGFGWPQCGKSSSDSASNAG